MEVPGTDILWNAIIIGLASFILAWLNHGAAQAAVAAKAAAVELAKGLENGKRSGE